MPSLNTSGTHLRRTYVKLCAGDRSAAVQRARELQMSIPFLKDGAQGRRPRPGQAGTSILTAAAGNGPCGARVARITVIR
jgi:hypothetical protein